MEFRLTEVRSYPKVSEDIKSIIFKTPLFHCCCFRREATGRCDCPQYHLFKYHKDTRVTEELPVPKKEKERTVKQKLASLIKRFT